MRRPSPVLVSPFEPAVPVDLALYLAAVCRRTQLLMASHYPAEPAVALLELEMLGVARPADLCWLPTDDEPSATNPFAEGT